MNSDNNCKIVENNVVESNVNTTEIIVDYTNKTNNIQKGHVKISREN